MKAALPCLGLLLMLGGAAAQACPPPQPTFVVFDSNSSVLPADRLAALNDLARVVRAIPARCSSFELRGFIDPSENGELVVARAESIRNFLVAEGALDDAMSVKVERVPVVPARGNPYSRAVTVRWIAAKGEWRCDPGSANPNFSTAPCQQRYLRCYFVLADGTVCNPQNVPDPNPETYSVVN
jgi:hypothetical protein